MQVKGNKANLYIQQYNYNEWDKKKKNGWLDLIGSGLPQPFSRIIPTWYLVLSESGELCAFTHDTCACISYNTLGNPVATPHPYIGLIHPVATHSSCGCRWNPVALTTTIHCCCCCNKLRWWQSYRSSRGCILLVLFVVDIKYYYSICLPTMCGMCKAFNSTGNIIPSSETDKNVFHPSLLLQP